MTAHIYPSAILSIATSLIILFFSVFNGNLWGCFFSPDKLKGRIFFTPAIGIGIISIFFLPWSLVFGFGTLQTWIGLIVISTISTIVCKNKIPEMAISIKEWHGIAPKLAYTILFAYVISFMTGSVDLIKFKDHGNFFHLSNPLTDHVKINIIQSFRNEGFPLQNPFASIDGDHSHFSYYFAWYMIATVFSYLLGPLSIAWDGDMAMTIVTSFASLLTIMGLSISLCQNKQTALSAARWSILLSLGGPIVEVVTCVIKPQTMERIFAANHGLETWVTQASWTPQHLMSGTLVVIALLLQQELLNKKPLYTQILTILLLSSLIASGFGMSAWVGGVSFLLSATAIAVRQIVAASSRQFALSVVTLWLITAITSAFMTAPYIYYQIGAAAAHGQPVVTMPLPVLAFTSPYSFLNYLSYWVLFLPLQIGCIYIPFLLSMKGQLQENEGIALPAILISFMCLITSWLFESQIANNDLGWRAVIPALLTMASIASAGISQFFSSSSTGITGYIIKRRCYMTCVIIIAVSLPSGLSVLQHDMIGNSVRQQKLVEDEYWIKLRYATPVSNRILTFPELYGEAESWPVNIGGGLLTQRKSCYLSHEYLRSFSSAWPHGFSNEANKRIHQFYNGLISQENMTFIHDKLHCNTIGITNHEKIWPLMSLENQKIPLYHVVEKGNDWIILSEDHSP